MKTIILIHLIINIFICGMVYEEIKKTIGADIIYKSLTLATYLLFGWVIELVAYIHKKDK